MSSLAQIKIITAHEILASGGYPSVEAVVTLEDGSTGIASVPYGASDGSHEAAVLTDADQTRYQGHGMHKAIANIVEQITPALLGQEATNQQNIDQFMIALDGTERKTRLGGNALLAVSVAVARAAAANQNVPLYQYLRTAFTLTDPITLPNPMAVAIEGGRHADHSTDLQEYCLTGLSHAPKTEVLRMILETYHHLRDVLQENHLSVNVGNEGAFAPEGITNNELPLQYLSEAVKRAGYQPGIDIGFSLDAAASEFYQDGRYHLTLEDKDFTAEELSQYYLPWLDRYPIVTVEDMHHEDDWTAWAAFCAQVKPKNIQIVGDDLTVTNPTRLQQAIDQQAITAILIKLNQIGTITETIQTCQLAKQHGLMTIPSHRGGGETNDTALVDLAVAVGSPYIKVGVTRGERVAKYNRLLEIEREIPLTQN